MLIRSMSVAPCLVLGCSFLVGCCGEKYETWELNGVYSPMTYNLSIQDASDYESVDHMILLCSPSGRITGRIAWVTDDDAGSTGDDQIDGRFEEVSGSFNTKSGWFKLKDTSVYGDIRGRLLENRKIELLQDDAQVGSPGAG
jgi:hypothetical protein